MTKDRAIERARMLTIADHIPRWVVMDIRGEFFIARAEAVEVLGDEAKVVWSSHGLRDSRDAKEG